ncbi:MAG: hypothetical protein Greene101420_482, partial [Parcubacteria group bacterium Greene1014_20]
MRIALIRGKVMLRDFNKKILKNIVIENLASGVWNKEREYLLAYSRGDNGVRSLLSSITIKSKGSDLSSQSSVVSGATADGVWTERKEMDLSYNTSQIGWQRDRLVPPSDFVFSPYNQRGDGVRWLDINGDSLVDFVYAFDFSGLAYNWNLGRWAETVVSDRAVFLRLPNNVWKKTPEYNLPVAIARKWRTTYLETRYADTGISWIDKDNDGLVDMAVSLSAEGNWGNVWYRNTGRGWEQKTNWGEVPGVAFKDANYGSYSTIREIMADDSGVQNWDWNGDHLPDLVGGTSSLNYDQWGRLKWGNISVRLANKNGGYQGAQSWGGEGLVVPGSIANNDTGTRIADINGDGLNDLVWSIEDVLGSWEKKRYQKTWINGGEYFYETEEWKIPTVNALFNGRYAFTYDAGTRFLDINHDGIMDIARSGGGSCWDLEKNTVYLGTGKGWIKKEGITLPWDMEQLGRCAYGSGITGLDWTPQNPRMAALTAEGGVDVFFPFSDSMERSGGTNYPALEYWKDVSSQDTDLLRTIKTYTGLEIELEYGSSHADYLGTPGLSSAVSADEEETKIENNYRVIRKMTRRDFSAVALSGYGVTQPNIVRTTQYRYFDLLFYKDPSDLFKNEALGFRKVRETLGDGSFTETYYHQGVGARKYVGMPEYTEDIAKSGQAFRVDHFDGTGKKIKSEEQNWQVQSVFGSRKRTVLAESISTLIDGSGSYSTAVGYQYDEVGNPIREIQYGKINLADSRMGTSWVIDTDSERRDIVKSYANFMSGRLSGWVSKQQLLNKTGQIESETRSYFDGLSLSQVGKGNPSKSENWLKEENRYILSDETFFDVAGNAIRTKDALGHESTVEYDGNKLFAIKTTNALGHVEEQKVSAWGRALEKTDANGNKAFTSYDGLNRGIKEEFMESGKDRV